MSTANQPSETVPKKLHTFRRIFKRVLPYRKLFYFSAFLAILLSLLGPCRPFLIMYTVDEFIFKNNFTGLLNMTMLLIGILLVESILRYFLIYATTTMGQLVVRDLRVSVFKHILSLRLKFFDRTPIGTLTTRTVNDVEAVNEIFSQGLIAIIADLLVLITVMAFMFYVDWRLTLISLAVFPLLIYSTYLFQKKVKGIFTEVRNQVSALNGFLQEHITGMNIIQIFSREKQEMKKFKAINKKLYKANFRTVWYYSIFFPVVEIFTACSIGLLVWWGSRGVINGKDIGVLIAFILYINMLFRPIRMIADRLGTLQMGIVASERIFKVLDTEEIIENNGKYMPENVEGKISFDKVWFAYDEDNYVLKDISFNVNAGESLAIVGATGAGKTSIINVLSRFYELNKGIIKIDDTDIRDFELNTLRSNIGVVLQDVFLFSGSVTSNISLNNKSIELEKIKEAARLIGAEKFIRKLPGDYDFDVMERGVTLSLGQRQLISFLRALVYDPTILVLDEATSSVDAESEEMIQNAIHKLMSDRTSIIIAHRLSTIQSADKIIVLDEGRLEESGTHAELLQINGFYKRLYDIQFKEPLPAV